VSAAKYRQRRKVYIDGLEDHVRQLNEKLENQSKVITALKTENQMLKEQNSYLKKLVESLSASMQSISPFNLVKTENSFGKAVKPMGAGLFLLAICCLVFSFSFQPFSDPGLMSSAPVRGASRTLLHHEDTLVHHDEEYNNDSTPFVSLPVPPQYSADEVETIVNVNLMAPEQIQTFWAYPTQNLSYYNNPNLAKQQPPLSSPLSTLLQTPRTTYLHRSAPLPAPLNEWPSQSVQPQLQALVPLLIARSSGMQDKAPNNYQSRWQVLEDPNEHDIP